MSGDSSFTPNFQQRSPNFTLWGGVATFFVFAALGFYISISAWDGMIYVSDLKLKGISGRVPAAIRKDLDFSRLNGAELLMASQKRLLTAAQVVHDSHGVGIEFGQFIIRSEDGQRQLACDFYDRVLVRLEADGMAASGQKPQMEINAPCSTSNDLALTEPIWIPTLEILAGNAIDGEATFGGGEASREHGILAYTSFRFKHMMNQWPRRWAVTEVTLYRESSPGHEVHVDQSDMRDFKRKPLIVTWPSAN
ncbi:MAG: hypothetical protein RBT63_00645 [Bdellovibrionales bacterium]|jgi:hypothetical protein|nr:hypothetical protein [Bdellovibrionales bacterium]